MAETLFNTPENERWRSFDIETLANNYGVNVVSAVRSYGHLGPFRPQPGVDFRGVRLFDILLRPNHIICSSTVSPGDTSQNLYGRWGVVIGTGTIEQAFPYDATSSVVDDEIASIFLDRLQDISPDEQMAGAIYGRAHYNEVNVRAESIAGVYFCIDEQEDPTTLDFPSEQTRQFIDKLSIPTFLLQNGTFHHLDSVSDFASVRDTVSPTDLTKFKVEVDEKTREELVSYLSKNLTLAPRNAVSSGLARGNFAHEYRTETQPYQYEDFLFEQSRLIAPEKRESLRLYGAIALHQFARRAEEVDAKAAKLARHMAQTVLSLDDFISFIGRVEANGYLSIERSEFEHYLATGKLPEYLSDH